MSNVYHNDITKEQAEFFDWCHEQPSKRPIDHSGGWQSCAVGEFARETNKKVREVSAMGWIEFAAYYVPEDLNDILSCQTQIGDHENKSVDDYGDLVELIKFYYM